MKSNGLLQPGGVSLLNILFAMPCLENLLLLFFTQRFLAGGIYYSHYFDKCECARAAQPNLAQVLHLINGDWLHEKVTHPEGQFPALLQADKTDNQIITTFYHAAFERQPSDDELQSALELIQHPPNRQEVLEDLLSTIYNCKEFLFNH